MRLIKHGLAFQTTPADGRRHSQLGLGRRDELAGEGLITRATRGMVCAEGGSALARIAQRRSATASQISLAWLLQRSPAMLSVPETSSIAHLEENLASASIRLTSDEFRTLASL